MIVDNKKNAEMKSDYKIPGENDITLRGIQAKSLDGKIKMISWSEDGLNYNIMVLDQKTTLDDIKKIAESLKPAI